MKKKHRWKCPVCRALNCKFNQNDVCIRDVASEIPGYRCPYFECGEANEKTNIYQKFT